MTKHTPDKDQLIADLLEALRLIAKAEGPFNRNPLEHAENVIESMVAIAEAAIAKATNTTDAPLSEGFRDAAEVESNTPINTPFPALETTDAHLNGGRNDDRHCRRP